MTPVLRGSLNISVCGMGRSSRPSIPWCRQARSPRMASATTRPIFAIRTPANGAILGAVRLAAVIIRHNARVSATFSRAACSVACSASRNAKSIRRPPADMATCAHGTPRIDGGSHPVGSIPMCRGATTSAAIFDIEVGQPCRSWEGSSMRMPDVALFGILAAALCMPGDSWSQEFRMQEVPSLPPQVAGALAPRTILFTDHRKDELVDPITGLIHFSDWERLRQQQKQLLSLFPAFEEPTISSSEGAAKSRKRRLHVYVAEARFALAKPAASIDLSKMITLAMVEQLDPSIRHRLISAAEVIPNKDLSSSNHNPKRQWCEGGGTSICIQSKYQLEGRLPTGIMLVNKIRENHKKIADFMEFQSELRLVPESEIDQAALAKATGIDAPVAGVVEQNIFYVNQIMQFGKFLAVLQPDPTDAKKSVATAFVALAVDSDLFEKKKELESVPILRN